MLFKPKYYKLETNFSQEEVFKILYKNTEEKRIRFSKSKYEFEGVIYKDHFKFMKTISSRNSFNPTINGSFNSNDNKTLITYNLKLNTFILIFFTTWIGFVTLFFIIVIIDIINKGINNNAFGFISIPLLFFGLALYFIGTKIIENKITETFEKLFNSKVEEIN